VKSRAQSPEGKEKEFEDEDETRARDRRTLTLRAPLPVYLMKEHAVILFFVWCLYVFVSRNFSLEHLSHHELPVLLATREVEETRKKKKKKKLIVTGKRQRGCPDPINAVRRRC
jgi:hypothetical protein